MVCNKKISLFAIALLVQLYVLAQNAAVVETGKNEGFMRSEGKIYVAMAVSVTILIGLIIFVYRLDKKITRLERRENN